MTATLEHEAITAAGVPEIVTPSPVAGPPYGLLVSARVINHPSDAHWGQGITWEEAPGVGNSFSGVYDPCAVTTFEIDATTVQTGAFTPFVIWAAERCAPQSGEIDVAQRARRNLERLQTTLIEAEFWSGTQAQASSWDNEYLTKAPVNLNSSSATMPVTALAELEAVAGDSIRGPMMIHCNQRTATFWAHHGLLRREGRLLLTALDTIVVPGTGYPGTAMDAATFAYATPSVEVHLGPIFDTGPHISDTNDRIHTAARLAAVTFDLLVDDAGDETVPVGINVSACSSQQSCPA